MSLRFDANRKGSFPRRGRTNPNTARKLFSATVGTYPYRAAPKPPADKAALSGSGTPLKLARVSGHKKGRSQSPPRPSPLFSPGFVHEMFRWAYPVGMSTKHVRTTGDLARFGCALKVECAHCHSARTLSAMAAVKALGMVPLQAVARRFRCLRCGMKQARVVVLPPV